ncbi:MAG: hypothetical protein IJ438_05935 [Clostridia bacterium]|nr:hypothetical protein [Clostridia bacterium]
MFIVSFSKGFAENHKKPLFIISPFGPLDKASGGKISEHGERAILKTVTMMFAFCAHTWYNSLTMKEYRRNHADEKMADCRAGAVPDADVYGGAGGGQGDGILY